MIDESVDGGGIALEHVEHAVRQTGLGEPFGEKYRRTGIAFTGLEDEGVATGDRHRQHPHRHHGREVERGDADTRADGLAHRPDIDIGGDLFVMGAFEQFTHTTRELHDLDAASHLAHGIGEHLAVLSGDDCRQLLASLAEDLAKGEHHFGSGGDG